MSIMRRTQTGSYDWHSAASYLAIFLCRNDWSVSEVRRIPGAYEMLVKYIEYPDQPWGWTVARLIGRLEYRPAVQKLHEYAAGTEGELTRRSAIEALRRLGYETITSAPSDASEP